MMTDESLGLGPGEAWTVEDVARVAEGHARASLTDEGARAMGRARAALLERVERGELVYGVTTGFGPLATTHVGPELAAELQEGLVHHLASGVGPPLSHAQARAIVCVRAINLSRGFSAARPRVVEVMCGWLESEWAPIVPSMGTVGASGDLTPLAHVALAMMGRAEVAHRGGRVAPSAEVAAELGIEPLRLGHKEGLALVNGTAAMTGVSALNAVSARRALDVGVQVTAALAQALGARAEAWSEIFDRARPHPGQRAVREMLQSAIAGSSRMRAPLDVSVGGSLATDRELLQDAYSLRCAPQLLGAVHDALAWHEQIVERELASVTDNPLVDPRDGSIHHGGNFFGQHVAFAADALRNAVVQIAILAERQLAWVTDASRSAGLPPFLTGGRPGLSSGLMGAQVTASALVAELRARSVPASIQSVPTNANNQDVVPMGTTAATLAAWSLERVWEVLAIGAMAAAQAIELRGEEGFSEAALTLKRRVRAVSGPLDRDRPLSAEIERLASALAR